jgi:hypothetical protein
LAAHRHWHIIDVSYPNIGGTFYYLSSILDGFSRHIALGHRESMGADIEDHIAGGQGGVAGSAAPDHLGQRAGVHRQGLHGVHADHRHDACPNLAVLPAIEREIELLAEIAQRGVHPAGNAVVAR